MSAPNLRSAASRPAAATRGTRASRLVERKPARALALACVRGSISARRRVVRFQRAVQRVRRRSELTWTCDLGRSRFGAERGRSGSAAIRVHLVPPEASASPARPRRPRPSHVYANRAADPGATRARLILLAAAALPVQVSSACGCDPYWYDRQSSCSGDNTTSWQASNPRPAQGTPAGDPREGGGGDGGVRREPDRRQQRRPRRRGARRHRHEGDRALPRRRVSECGRPGLRRVS